MRQLQRALSLIYPDQCIMCEARVEHRGGLCGPCWRQMPFLNGLVCHSCGTSLPGEDTGEVFCDDCMAMPRPWEIGRGALSYRDAGRRLVLSIKHADRLDLIPPASQWMARAGQSLVSDDTVLVPVPAHWSRLVRRRYNQAAELARGIARETGLSAEPDALIRVRRTTVQDGMTVDQRFANLRDCMAPNPKRPDVLLGKPVCLIDDVMTSGATLTIATEAAFAAGASRVCVLVLARVEKAP